MLKVLMLQLLLLCSLVISCAKPNETVLVHRAEIESQRRAKDQHFKHDVSSPLPETAKAGFTGLNYFPVDFNYRFEGAIEKFTAPETLALATSDGRVKQALRYGRFSFMLERQHHSVEVYRLLTLPAHYANYLFIPFTDLTSGEEAYSGGRYLDLVEQENNRYIVDFNLAYNPSCAYGRKDFSCPIPPRANALAVRLAAGEKDWSAAAQ